ncbi:hypothetical protein [Bacillus sp. TH30]|uniref:Uncharacterized protein n=1 Tax=Bacillus cereus HuA4-10 TaxID=1053206 RepID=J8DRE3_BACCE|nr:hypothetical protein [Bacillus sp. TH30]EJQ81827.1 hypothetical protein IGC_02066 [Bacillus cereus HuA4-10]
MKHKLLILTIPVLLITGVDLKMMIQSLLIIQNVSSYNIRTYVLL